MNTDNKIQKQLYVARPATALQPTAAHSIAAVNRQKETPYVAYPSTAVGHVAESAAAFSVVNAGMYVAYPKEIIAGETTTAPVKRLRFWKKAYASPPVKGVAAWVSGLADRLTSRNAVRPMHFIQMYGFRLS